MKPSETDLLIFEPQIVGHRLTWLRYITEDFLDLGFKIAWAVDLRPKTRSIIEEHLSALLSQVSILSVFDKEHRWKGGSKVKALDECLRTSQAKQAFLNELDEIASNLLRWAAMGILPPHSLQGCLSGVYFRPRFMTDPFWPIGNIIKCAGFRRLHRQGWFRHIYLMDEYLFSSLNYDEKENIFHFLPDPWSGDFSVQSEDAKAALTIPTNKVVFLHYGRGDRRKGLHLVVDAIENLKSDSPIFLLCAGKLSHDYHLVKKLEALEERGLAKLVNRYVTDEEERLYFCAADAVLLPYIHHYGSSGVLSRAAAAGKMVIASDEGLLARRIRDHELGFLFQTKNSQELQQRMSEIVSLSSTDRDHFRNKSLEYAMTCSREAFRNALISPWRSSIMHSKHGQPSTWSSHR